MTEPFGPAKQPLAGSLLANVPIRAVGQNEGF